jgi:hypothetical protein
MPGPRFGGREGQTAVFVALQLTLTFAFVGFLVDLGFSQYLKHAMQAAADSAAMAAAAYAHDNSVTCGSGVTCGGSPANCTYGAVTAFVAGCMYAKVNGYKQGTGNQTVTMFANNTGGPVSGSSILFFTATVGDSRSTLFGRFAGQSALSLKASATAQVSTTGGGSCIISLSHSGTGFSDSGSGNVTTSGCGIYDNSGFSYSGAGNITTQATDYYGSYSDTGAGNLTPAPTSVTSYMSDPFASVPAPTVSSTCTATGYSISDSSNHTIPPSGASGTYVYCGGLQLSGSGNITFASNSIFIINGTDAGGKSFDYTGSGNLTGTNVMFFITGQNGYTAGPVKISGSGNLTFSAQSSGTYQGLLFYQDRGVSYASANNYSGSGNVTGSFYFPTTSLSYSGSGNDLSQALVANTITMSGSGNISLARDTTGQYTGLVRTVVNLLQ